MPKMTNPIFCLPSHHHIQTFTIMFGAVCHTKYSPLTKFDLGVLSRYKNLYGFNLPPEGALLFDDVTNLPVTRSDLPNNITLRYQPLISYHFLLPLINVTLPVTPEVKVMCVQVIFLRLAYVYSITNN